MHGVQRNAFMGKCQSKGIRPGEDKTLQAQLAQPDRYVARRDLIFADDETKISFTPHGWTGLQECIRPGDTVVASLDRFSSHFEEGIAIEADLTRRGIRIVAIKENIDTRPGIDGAAFYRRILLAHGDCLERSTGAPMTVSQQQAEKQGRKPGRPPALDGEGIAEARRLYAGNGPVRRTARTLGVAAGTVKRALGLG